MSEWKINLAMGIVALVLGVVFMLLSTTLTLLPSVKPTILSVGLLFTGGGVGTLSSTYTIYKLEKRLDFLSSSPP